MLIQVVVGSTGEYSDRSEWLAKAFRTKSEAEEYIRLLQENYRQFSGDYGYTRTDEEAAKLEKTMQELDPHFQEDYTGTYWFAEEVEFENSRK
jgi:hypothetical protein